MRPNEVERLSSELAKSGMLVWPMMMAPAARSLATTGASLGANSSWPFMVKPAQPLVVIWPAMEVLALITMGTPQSGP